MTRKTFFLVLVVFLSVLGPAAAQDSELNQMQLFESGTSFSFPDGWEVEANEGTLIVIAGEITRVTLVDHAHFTNAGVAATGQSKSLTWYFNETHQGDIPFNAGAVRQVEVADRAALRYDYEFDSGNAGLMLLIEFTDGGFGVVDAISLDGDLEEEDAVLAIAASFDSGGRTPLTGGAAGSSVESSGVPCTVSTSQARTVRIRVGPGENRTSYAFLPTNTPFEVLGQATADDDSLWWKLDRETVAPNAAANEAWVAQEDVESEGDCDGVRDVNAPPIIPIITAPPPEEPAGQPPAEGQPPPPAEGGGALPSPGTWTVFYRSPAPGSCIGNNITQQTIYVDIPIAPETYSLTVSGSGFTLGDRRHTPLSGNRYRGQWNFGAALDNISADSILTVVSPSQMVGELRFTLVEGDIACSITVSITVTRG